MPSPSGGRCHAKGVTDEGIQSSLLLIRYSVHPCDEIMTVAKKRAEESLATFKELKERYEKVKSTLMPEK